MKAMWILVPLALIAGVAVPIQFAAIIIGGQMIASVVLDHFGLLNLPTSPANLPKLAGAVLVVVGAIIVLSYREG